MQYSEGRIVSVTDAAATRSVVVEVEPTAVCPRCAEGKGCGAGIFGGPGESRRVSASVEGELEVHTGDRVNFVLAPRKLLQAAIVVYGYPLAAAVFAALLAFALGLSELAAATAALLGIIVGFAVARQTLKSQRCLRDFTPVVVENLDASAR